jgi:hypothetical protein
MHHQLQQRDPDAADVHLGLLLRSSDRLLLVVGNRRPEGRKGIDERTSAQPPRHYFEYQPDISWPHGNNPRAPKMPRAHFLDRTRLRGGCTVSGVALQFAHYGGAKNIVLCGVDMEGRGHWDGFQNPDKYNLCGGVWPWVEPLQILCDIITERGTKVWTMSKTALRLPTWEG